MLQFYETSVISWVKYNFILVDLSTYYNVFSFKRYPL